MFSEASTSAAYFDVISMHESQLSIDVIVVFVGRYSSFTERQQGCKGSPKRHAAKQTQSPLSRALRAEHRNNRRCSPSFQTPPPPPNARKQQ